MASSGVTLEEDVVSRYTNDFKMMKTRRFRFQSYCFNDDKTKICVFCEGSTDQELSNHLKSVKDSGQPVYFVYLNDKDSSSNDKILLCLYSDDDSVATKHKMLAASSFGALKKTLIGYNVEKELHSLDDILEELGLPPPSC